MFRSTILLLYTTTVDVCCGKRVKKNLRKGELVCVWGAVGKEEGLVAYLTPTTRPSRRTKSKQKASCFFLSFFLFLYMQSVYVRFLSLTLLFSYPFLLFSCQTPPFFFLPFLLFYPRFHSFDYGCDWLFLGYRHFLFSSSPHLYLFFFFF